MKKLIGSALITAAMVFGFAVLCHAEQSNVIYYDGFDTDTSAKYLVDGRPEGSISIENGVAKFSASSWTRYKTTVSSQAEKVVLEYRIDKVQSGKYQLALGCGSALFNNDRNEEGVFYGILDTGAGSYSLYNQAGILVDEVSVSSGSTLSSVSLYVATNASIFIDYIKVYEYNGIPCVLDRENADIRKFDIEIDLPVKDGVDLKDYIDVNDTAVKDVTLKDESKNIYTVELFDDLEFESENTISYIGIPVINGEAVGGDTVFTTRPRHLKIEPTLRGDELTVGENILDIYIQNEIGAESGVLIAALYDDGGNMRFYNEPLDMESGNREMIVGIDELAFGSRLELFAVDSLDAFNIISNKHIYRYNAENSVEEVAKSDTTVYMQQPEFDPEDSVATFTLKLSDSSAVANVYLKLIDKENKLLYICDKKTEKGTAEFVVKLPAADEAEKYTVFFGRNGIGTDSVSVPYVFTCYPMSYIKNCFEILSSVSAKDITKQGYSKDELDALIGFVGSYGYNLDRTEPELQKILASTISIRDEDGGFVNREHAYSVIKDAIMIIIERKEHTEDFIENFNSVYKLNEAAYNVYCSSELTSGMKESILDVFSVGDAYNITDVRHLFENSVLSGVIRKSTHYMQVHWILDAMSYIIESDNSAAYSAYMGLNDSNKQKVETALVGYGGDVTARLAALVSENKGSGTSSGGSGGSGGGGGSVKTDTKKSGMTVISGSTSASADLIGSPAATKEPEPTEAPSLEHENFTDLEGFDWAKNAIEYLTENHIVDGVGKGRFYPEGNVTRREAAKLISVAFGLTDNGIGAEFGDVFDYDWAKPYIEAVSANGIMVGNDDNMFMPDGDLTREMLAAVIYRTLRLQDVEINHADADYVDAEEISDYAKESVTALTAVNILNGTGDGKFSPKQICKRAEAVVILYRVMNYLDLITE